MGIKHTSQIVEGVMNRVLSEIGRLVWNCLQERWGDEWDAQFTPLEAGAIAVVITELDSCDHIMAVNAFGFEVRTWLDSKRPYYHAHLPDDWSNRDFIDWAERVFEELDRLQKEWYDNRHKRSASLPIVQGRMLASPASD